MEGVRAKEARERGTWTWGRRGRVVEEGYKGRVVRGGGGYRGQGSWPLVDGVFCEGAAAPGEARQGI